jgi:hypothetical protein
MRQRLVGVGRRALAATTFAGATAGRLLGQVPGRIHSTRAGADRTTRALQRLPDSKLRWLAASSVGLGAGFYLAGAPRLVAAAGVAPALVMGAAIALRPTVEGALDEAAE